MHYRGFGLHILSDLPVGGAEPINDGSPVDLLVRLGDIVAGAPEQVDGPYARHGDAVLFTMEGTARYLCSANAIVVELQANADVSTVQGMLVATALPASLWLSGCTLLHASAVVLPGETQCTLLAGPSGVGKSTLAAALMSAGATVLSDDCVAMRQDSKGISCSGLPAQLLLSSEQNVAEGRTAQQVPTASRSQSTGIARILHLQRHVSASAAEAVPTPNGFESLLRARHRPRVARIMSLEGAAMPALANIARSASIYSLSISQDTALNVAAVLHLTTRTRPEAQP